MQKVSVVKVIVGYETRYALHCAREFVYLCEVELATMLRYRF
jgi:hypothetical protein